MIEAHASMKRIYLLILVLSGCPFVLGPGASARSLGDGKGRNVRVSPWHEDWDLARFADLACKSKTFRQRRLLGKFHSQP